MASTYDASGKLIGCSEQDLNAIISAQLYTVFALGSGLYIYKSLTAENWVDIAVNIGWNCVLAFTHTKRAFNKYVLPGVIYGLKVVSAACEKIAILGDEGTDDDSTVSDDNYCYVRVIKDGFETRCYLSLFAFVNDIHDNFVELQQESDGDVVNVELSEANEEIKNADNKTDGHDQTDEKNKDNVNNETANADGSADADANVNADGHENANANADDEADDDDSDDEDSDDDDISEIIKNIESHTMKFDFVLTQVPTVQTIANKLNSNTEEGMHVMKYDGFPRDSNGVHFYDRKFVPVDHRMMEIVLQYDGNEYDLNLASPDNFYVAGNKLLDPAFLKWFMFKNHGVHMVNNREGSDGVKCDYTIKCLDNEAVLHTLFPHNYLYVSVTGFEVQDSGLV